MKKQKSGKFVCILCKRMSLGKVVFGASDYIVPFPPCLLGITFTRQIGNNIASLTFLHNSSL